VIGIDHDQSTIDAARRGGIYQQVYVAPADKMSFPPGSMASAFANCSLEHMQGLPEVLKSIWRCLRPGGPFLLSVVTDKFVEWRSLPLLVKELGDVPGAERLDEEYNRYHNLVSAFDPGVWVTRLEAAGFDVSEHIPIMPELTSRLFLFLDHVWHLPQPQGETGERLYSRLLSLPRFDRAFRQILEAMMSMELDWSVGSGAVFVAKRRG
jgi:SAM-dependent methyltransferase